ncbi:6-phosphogluconolactonase [Hymenobacter gelipurpurascens]|uniref:6-phosphogluconolactonase n=1 Tax=Hymenobacter gelipurpurascens TaxID=89968 RepID=A0A212T9C2_9BACT|nr:6-phosphogluconolactonase [Hymenobacter gelipurpurascens]SNC62619.1 6-phosphogluconolactonase [Hymenobacter gelipurpurascens]
MQLHIFSLADEVLGHLADYFVQVARQAIAARGKFTVALSGGSSPKKLYELLASPAYRDQVNWQQVFFFFGDERYVPHTDAESNYRMARLTLLDPLLIAPEQVFAIDTILSPAEAAANYTQTIERFFGDESVQLDLVLLGLGDNSHTASLFPHTPVLHDTSVGAREVFLEDKQVYRITLTAPLLNQARAVAFLVYGPDKAAAVQRVLTEAPNIEEFPAQLIVPTTGELHWFLDESAASKLPK